ncbi:uncharacterized protein [Cherax quadricarinatus]|uniref:uncharacterized protein n=1 Tax=Cherax quadricarinatus TaxID=27406 RepID=UPI00387EA4C5
MRIWVGLSIVLGLLSTSNAVLGPWPLYLAGYPIMVSGIVFTLIKTAVIIAIKVRLEEAAYDYEEYDLEEEAAPGSAEGGYDAAPHPPADGGYVAAPHSSVEGGYDAAPHPPADGGYVAAPHSSVEGGYDAAPHPSADGGYDVVPHPSVEGGYDTAPHPSVEGSYDTAPHPSVEGGYDTAPHPSVEGGYDTALHPSVEGGYAVALHSSVEGGYDAAPHPSVEGGNDASLHPSVEGGYNAASHPTVEGGGYVPAPPFIGEGGYVPAPPFSTEGGHDGVPPSAEGGHGRHIRDTLLEKAWTVTSADTHSDAEICIPKLLCHLHNKKLDARSQEENLILKIFSSSPEPLLPYKAALLKATEVGGEAICDEVFRRCPLARQELTSLLRQMWGCGSFIPQPMI